MRLAFDEQKTTQVAAQFLRLADGHLNYMVLIKFLYLVDRESLLRWGRPVTFDEYFSMFRGPVLSRVLNLVTEMPEGQESVWNKYIAGPSNWEVSLKENPGSDLLSEAEQELIEETFNQFRDLADKPFELVALLHKTLPEWDKDVPKGNRTPLSVMDILKKAGKKSDEEITSIYRELKSRNTLQNLAVKR